MLVSDPAVRRAAKALFGGNAFVNNETIHKFEQAYHCQIQRTNNQPWLVPKITFNTKEAQVLFILRWS